MKKNHFYVAALAFSLSLLLSSSAFAGGDTTKDEAMSKFVSFSEKWVQVLNKKHNFSRLKKVVLPAEQGFQGKYHEIDKETIVCKVKPTKSKKVPFIGILRYTESIYISEADSKNAAKNGPYTCNKEIAVTEVFNFSNGKWQY